jgi:glycosyltransferase involved in cell wall biosynthesis
MNSNETPKISIVVPMYNTESYISDCIESVLKQTFKDIELILVNDGSTQKEEFIALQYRNSDSRIKYIKQKNSGVSIARNKGLENSIGNYIYFMDSDDKIDKKFLETSYNKAITEDSDVVFITGLFSQKEIPEITAAITWSLLIKKDFLLKNSDVRFPENIQPGEDGIFSHKVFALTDKISINDKGIYHYRRHEKNNSKLAKKDCSRVYREIPKWFEELDKFYEHHNLFLAKALHLARFIHHEPFGRLIGMNFNQEEKNGLKKLISEYMETKVLLCLTKAEYEKLPFTFKLFLETKNVDWTIFVTRILKFFVNFIPLKKLRKKIRRKYL